MLPFSAASLGRGLLVRDEFPWGKFNRWPGSCQLVPQMTEWRQRIGESGEDLACRELTARGYAILERRYRTRHGEIDIVAQDGDTMVFVEVRMKTTLEFGSAAESVTRQKQRRVIAMALEYLARHSIANRPCRFDVVAIDHVDGGSPVLTLIPGAFDAT